MTANHEVLSSILGSSKSNLVLGVFFIKEFLVSPKFGNRHLTPVPWQARKAVSPASNPSPVVSELSSDYDREGIRSASVFEFTYNTSHADGKRGWFDLEDRTQM